MTTTPVHSITDEQIAEIEDDGCYATAAEFNAIIARLRKAEKDAARYRFVRKLENDCWMLNTLQCVSEAELDAAIDAAMAGGGE